MALDVDPWQWSVNDVASFFLHPQLQQFISGVPHAELPDMSKLSTVLADHRVTGATLLTAVDAGFLREECGIKQLGVRGTVSILIRKLQTCSLGYQRLTAIEGVSTTINEVTLANSLQIAPPTESGTGDNARAGETVIQDEHSRKRRRLNLMGAAAMTQERTQKASTFATEEIGGYLPPNSLSVSEIFFGKTAVGAEITYTPVNHPNFVDDSPEDAESANFAFVNYIVIPSTAAYVSSQMRHSLQAGEESAVDRQKRVALVRYPYRSRLQADVSSTPTPARYDVHGNIYFEEDRSAIVVHRSNDGTLVATRESQLILTSGAFQEGYTSEQADGLHGEFSYLLAKYPADASKMIPLEDEGSDVVRASVGPTESDAVSRFADDQAEEDDEDELGPDQVTRIIDDAITSYLDRWTEIQLPLLEAKEARKTWRKMKHSKSIRNGLIEHAQDVIVQLDSRMERFKEDIKAQQWETHHALSKQCEIFEVTLADREKEQWKISVWRRRQESGSATRARAANGKKALHGAQPANDMANALRGLGPDDRLTVSPVASEANALPTTSTGEGAERFYTPQNSSPPQPAARESSDSPFVVDDGDHADESDQHESDQDNVDLPAEQNSDRMSSAFPITPTSKRQSASQIDSPLPIRPSMSAFARNEAPAHIVDLTGLSSSTPESAAKKPAKKKKKTRAQDARQAAQQGKAADVPDNATAEEVDAWDFEDLAATQDRRRILIKLFKEAGRDRRASIHQTFQILMKIGFLGQMVFALRRLQGDKHGSKDLDAFRSHTMLYCARMATAWYFARPELMDAESFADLGDEVPTQASLSTFTDQLRAFMLKKDSNLFVNRRATSAAAPLEIYDSDERRDPHQEEDDLSDDVNITPSSGKKHRKVDLSQSAMKERRKGKERLELMERAQAQSQSSNAVQLRAMLPAAASHSAIEINLTRPEGAEPIYVHPDIARKMKPHQVEGVQFLWREVVTGCGGALLAHTMGLGKTMQTITLMVALNEASQASSETIWGQLPAHLQLGEQRKRRQLRFLILCPPMLLQNWRREIEQWAPAYNLAIHLVTSTTDKAGEPALQTTLGKWSRAGGFLCVGYSVFRILTNRKPEVTKKDPELWAWVDRVLFLEPELAVIDEAQNVKNQSSTLHKVVSSIRTKSRLALSATPLANSIDEIYSVINWVAPGYLGDLKEFSGRFGIPIKEGLYADSTYNQRRKSLMKLKVLEGEIAAKINRKDITVLRGVLKSKTEFILTVELTAAQRKSYTRYSAVLLGDEKNSTASQVALFAWLAVLQLLLSHPVAYRTKLLTPVPPKKKAKPDLELPEDGVLADEGVVSPRNAEEDEVDVDGKPFFSIHFALSIRFPVHSTDAMNSNSRRDRSADTGASQIKTSMRWVSLSP